MRLINTTNILKQISETITSELGYKCYYNKLITGLDDNNVATIRIRKFNIADKKNISYQISLETRHILEENKTEDFYLNKVIETSIDLENIRFDSGLLLTQIDSNVGYDENNNFYITVLFNLN